MEQKNDLGIEQTQIKLINDNNADCVKHNIHNDTRITLSPKNQSDIEYYELLEAKNADQYIKECVKSTKHIIDQNPAKSKDYDEWTTKKQYEYIMTNLKKYFVGVPDSLLFFISAAFYRGDCGRRSLDKPFWLDMEKFQRGQKFARDHIFSLLFANIVSLFGLFTFEDGLKPLILNQKSHTPYLAFKRYLSTNNRINNWMMEDPWTVGTKAFKDIQTVRKMHRAVRTKMCENENKKIDAACKIERPLCPDRHIILQDFASCPYPTVEKGCVHLLVTPKGLNQADMAATQFAFIGMAILYSEEFGIYASDEDLDAFCHTWQAIGYLLGVEDQYNFCRDSLEEVKQRSRDFIEVWVKHYFRQVTPEWEHMLRCAVEGARYQGSFFTFKTLLVFLTELLMIDMPRLRSNLTYIERFQLMFQRFIFRYAMKWRFIRQILNKIVCYKIAQANNYSSEKHEKLKKLSQQVLDKN